MREGSLREYTLQYGVRVTVEEAARWREAWFDMFPEMRGFLGEEQQGLWRRAAVAAGLTPVDYGAAVGRPRYGAGDEGFRPAPWLGAMLLKVLREEAPMTGKGRPYDVSELDFFWSRAQVLGPHLKGSLARQLASRRSSYRLYQAARNVFDREGVFTLTGRLRAAAGYCARHNTVFQGLASCGAKLALWRLWRSPLLREQGCRLVNFIHDEVVLEVPEGGDLVAVAGKVRAALVEEVRRVVPDVKVGVKLGYRRRWGSDPTDEVPVEGVK
jgi:hypothetical protein